MYPSVSKYLSLTFLHNFNHCLIQKIMQVSFTLLTHTLLWYFKFDIVSFYSHSDNFFNKTNAEVERKR
jgi:hypothetical protein